MVTVDARGLSCPQPVMLAKQAIDKGEFPIEVLVDTVTSRENVRRLAQRLGLKVQAEPSGDGFKVTLDK
ncbi:MAG: sulfurtransferase TusA family protein [Anaerolineales bacterium]|nr:sulfurtransferase TusA family protein [Anaerolineae bacterium]